MTTFSCPTEMVSRWEELCPTTERWLRGELLPTPERHVAIAAWLELCREPRQLWWELDGRTELPPTAWWLLPPTLRAALLSVGWHWDAPMWRAK